MFYRFLTLILPHFTFRVFFRRIFYSNLGRVPFDKPLLFVGNHQNSFMDGILVGSWLTQAIHFTMRADMFRNRVARFSLRELHVAPVYRLEEGFENVHRNQETFEVIYDILRKNGNFIMFSEGICVQEKRLQKLRKGTARLAYGAAVKYGLDVHIVPVGINYTHPASFRKEVMINFHEAFSIRELLPAYEENPAKALLQFNARCEAALRDEVVIIDDPADDQVSEDLLAIKRNDMTFPFFGWRFADDRRLRMEKEVADRINSLSKDDPERHQMLKKEVDEYKALLSSRGLNDESVSGAPRRGWLRYITLFAGLPFMLAGYLLNLIPFIVPRLLSDTLIKDKRFYSSVYISAGTVLYLIYLPLLIVIGSVFAGWAGAVAALAVPLLGYWVLFYREIALERYYSLRYFLLHRGSPQVTDDLGERRRRIVEILGVHA